MMKLLYFFLLAAALSSCKDAAKNTPADRETTVERPSAPVQFTVEDSLALTPKITAHYRNRVLLVTGISEKSLLDSIYAPFTDVLFEYTQQSITAALQRRKADFYESQRKLAIAKEPDTKQVWTDYRDMKWKSEENGFLTLLYIHEGYSGGAHGFHTQTYRTLDLRNLRKLQLYDLIQKNRYDWDGLLRKSLAEADNEIARMVAVSKLSPAENFYIENGRLHFVYNPYEIAPYAAGIITIPVELSQIKDQLTPEFRTRAGLQ